MSERRNALQRGDGQQGTDLSNTRSKCTGHSSPEKMIMKLLHRPSKSLHASFSSDQMARYSDSGQRMSKHTQAHRRARQPIPAHTK